MTSEHPPGSPGAGPAREVLEAGTGDPAVDAALQPLRDLLAAGGPGPGADPGRDLRVLTDVHDALARRLAGSAG